MRRILGCILGLVLVGALACSDGPEIADPCLYGGCSHWNVDGAALFSATCSGCHSLEQPVAAHISTRADAWGLMREMNANGVSLPDYKEAAIVKYLCSLKSCVDR